MKSPVYLPEILEAFSECSKKVDKIALLQSYSHVRGFMRFLYLTYDPNIKWCVTREEVENLTYDHMDIPDYDTAPTTIFLESQKRLFNYTNVLNPMLSKEKVKQKLANLFSVLHHEEVELVKQCINKKLKVNGLTEKLVREAFPELLYEKGAHDAV